MTFQQPPPRVWGKACHTMSWFSTLGSPPRVWEKDLKDIEKHCIILKYTVVAFAIYIYKYQRNDFCSAKKTNFHKKLHLTARGIDGVSFVKSKNQKFTIIYAFVSKYLVADGNELC